MVFIEEKQKNVKAKLFVFWDSLENNNTPKYFCFYLHLIF